MQQPERLFQTDLPLPNRREGKVRDLYDLEPARSGDPARLLIIATDRISAFDVVLPSPIPGKGRILSAISARWFSMIEREGLSRTHTLSLEASDIPGISPTAVSQLTGRIVIARQCRVTPVECVVRGYLAGSGWLEYQDTQSVCGVRLPAGLRNGDDLPEPIFTPATKAPQGAHDENISFDRACELAGGEVMEGLRDRSIAIYRMAHAFAIGRDVILADTKFEFGFAPEEEDGDPILIDEALTPDSSRFWPADSWKPGSEQASFDKQFVRNYLLTLVAKGDWNKQAPGPTLPDEIIEQTRQRYLLAAQRLFDLDLNMASGAEVGR